MKESATIVRERLQKEILSMQENKPALYSVEKNNKLGYLHNLFPDDKFPLAALHEFISIGNHHAATLGFISGLLSTFIPEDGFFIWVGNTSLYPPSLLKYGIDPAHLIFIQLQKEKEIQWTVEEGLKCPSIHAVIAEIPGLNFIGSRRLQLAIEKSQVPCFIIRQNPRSLHPTVAAARWQISSLPGSTPDELPGVGYPKWEAKLLKVKNGTPGAITLEFAQKKFRFYCKEPSIASMHNSLDVKTG